MVIIFLRKFIINTGYIRLCLNEKMPVTLVFGLITTIIIAVKRTQTNPRQSQFLSPFYRKNR